MENEKEIKIALIRGDSLNEWEGRLWERFDKNFSTTGFCARKNLYAVKNITYPIERLSTSSDNFVVNNINKYFWGIFQKMYGLENKLIMYDIAHTVEISYFYTLQAVRAKKKNPRLKVVTTVWDNSFGRFEYNYWPGFEKVPRFWTRKMRSHIDEVSKGVDIFLPVSQMSAGMLNDLGVPTEKIKILTPAVVLEESVTSREELPKKLQGKEMYFMVCRLIKEKGVYDVLYAWKMYLKERKSIDKVLVIFGSGPEQENMIRLICEWGMVDTVEFLGNIPNNELRKLYKHAKVLILASIPNSVWQEQFGYVLAEAITQECPVVSTYSGAIPEIVGEAGLLFSPGNPVELKKRLKEMDNPEIYEKLKKNCIKVRSKFSMKKFTSELTETYLNLL